MIYNEATQEYATRKFIKIILIFLVSLFCIHCGSSEELKKTRIALEKHPQIIKNGYKIGKIKFLPKKNLRDTDLRFEAELLNSEGLVIGKVEGVRVEGFATDITRIEYNTPQKNIKKQTEPQTNDPIGGLLKHLKRK